LDWEVYGGNLLLDRYGGGVWRSWSVLIEVLLAKPHIRGIQRSLVELVVGSEVDLHLLPDGSQRPKTSSACRDVLLYPCRKRPENGRPERWKGRKDGKAGSDTT
jgi:hypothetical protein